MSLASTIERSNRTAPSSCFSGGYVGHGPLVPLDTPRRGFFARLFRRDGRGRVS